MMADRVVGGLAALLGLVLYMLAGESEAYLFPRGIATAIGVLGVLILATTFARARVESSGGTTARLGWSAIVPVIVIFIAYRWALEIVGFYVAALAAFLVIVSLYDPGRASAQALLKRAAISIAFVGALYAIFAALLRVRTPTGLLF